MMLRVTVWIALLTLPFSVSCGADVDEPQSESDGTAGGSSASSSTSSASSASSSRAATTGSGGGPIAACAGDPCGVICAVCNDIECLHGTCDGRGTCAMEPPRCGGTGGAGGQGGGTGGSGAGGGGAGGS